MKKNPGVVTQLCELQPSPVPEPVMPRIRAVAAHELSQPASSPERAAHASFLLDRVRMLPNRSPTAEMNIVSSMDHHSTTAQRLNRAFGEYLPQEESMAELKVRSALSRPDA